MLQRDINQQLYFAINIVFPNEQVVNKLIIIRQKLTSMNGQSPVDIILQAYTFKKERPIFTNANYNVYDGVQTETKLPVTIKILKPFHFELPKYLKKLKQCRSDNVIKVYEVASDNSTLVFITEKVVYGNMKDALIKCQRLDDTDSVFISKLILNGHTDLLRTDCNWFGTEQDIEFTDSGLKLSWNNSVGYNLVNPFPKILQKISMRPEDKGGDQNLLPFPKNKVMIDLIKVSKENASQISLNPHIKKKEKFAKKKGKDWLGLKEYKNKNQYFEETIYLAISSIHGFIRVKMYPTGKFDPNIVSLNKNKRTFTKYIEHYDEGNKSFMISEYSNDGHLQAYVAKLKSSGVTLTEDHIQFFFYSMFEPLKQVQESTLKSINMLHIRNIYIQNGIPKIGDPIAMNQNVEQLLIDRSDVPDFYHKSFKSSPSTHLQTYDTYSLGVLLYKLMYTEYPIFPNQQVHIPTTPNYSKKLKKTLQIFLNVGGKLKDIESQIEVSQNVLKQVQENKEKLVVKVKNQKVKEKKKMVMEDVQSEKIQLTEKSDQVESVSQDGDQIGCCALCCTKLELSPNEQAGNKYIGVTTLEESPYRIYRICTKLLFVTALYIFLFYFFYIQNNINFLFNNNLLINLNVTIATVDYNIITTDKNIFETTYNTTSKTVDSLLGMGCLINSYEGNPDYYTELVYDGSGGWIGFLVGSILLMVVIMVLKCWQIYKFDLIKMIYNYDHGHFNFNVSNWLIFNLLWTSLINGHFYFFNFVFRGTTQPCVGGLSPFASTDTLFNDFASFQTVYLTMICLQLAVTLGQAIMIGFTYRIKYNKLLNPIFIFAPLLVAQWVIIRIGVIPQYFYPNALDDRNGTIMGFLTNFEYINILGMIPEILLIMEFLLAGIIDLIYWSFLDKRRKLLINETSAASLQEL